MIYVSVEGCGTMTRKEENGLKVYRDFVGAEG